MSSIKVPREAIPTLSRDRVVSELLDTMTINFPPSRGSVYEDLIEAIVYQQISIKAAKSIFDRFITYFGGLVPDAPTLVAVPHEELRALGLSNQKASYIRNIAAFFMEQKLSDNHIAAMDDETIIARLTGIKGVGVWTVQMILIFSLVRPDVFPVRDYGIQVAMKELYGIQTSDPRKLHTELEEIATAWRPYRTFGTLLMWSWKRKQMGL